MASFFATTEYGIDDEDGADGADDDPYAVRCLPALTLTRLQQHRNEDRIYLSVVPVVCAHHHHPDQHETRI
jgi:hypothetical protein